MKMIGMHEDFAAPSVYEHDDTPKAFRRLMQQKQNKSLKKKNDSASAHGSVSTNKSSTDSESVRYGETFSEYNTRMMNEKKKTSHDITELSSHQSEHKGSLQQSKTVTTFAEASKSIRKKRKAHLQARDLKKKAQRSKSDFHDENRAAVSQRPRYIKDIVSEPPKLEFKPKKVFKRINEDLNVPEWSEEEVEAEDN